VKSHAPVAHVAVAFGEVGHWVVHAPQWSASVWRSTQERLHAVRPFEQVALHALLSHTCVSEHCVLHDPQLSTSFVTSMQVPPQLASDGSHFTPQTPPAHEG